MPITGLYAGLLTLISLYLWMGVSGTRMKTRISLLHGDDLHLAEKVRRHANFSEHVPLALVLLGIIEINHARAGLLHGLGIVLTLGRVLHPLGIRHDVIPHPLRGIGAGATFVVTLVAGAVAIWQYVSG
jgi:uncharacterized membrane protein YecN with MAPEG domain